MFKRSKSLRAETVGAVADAMRTTYGNAVVISTNEVAVGIRLESGAGRDAGVYGPEDGLGVALADVLRHITGTPPLDTSGADVEPVVTTSDPRPYLAAKEEAQRDLLAVLADQVADWRASSLPGVHVVSFLGLERFLGTLEDRLANGGYIERPPF